MDDLSSNAVPPQAGSWITICEDDLKLLNANLSDKHTKGSISKKQVEATIVDLIANNILLEGYYPPEVEWRVITYALRRQNPTKLKKAACTSIDTPIKWKRFKNELLKCENGNLPQSLDVSIEKSYGTLIVNEQHPDPRCKAFKEKYEEDLRIKNATPEDRPCTPEEEEHYRQIIQAKLDAMKSIGGSMKDKEQLKGFYNDFEVNN